MRSLGQNAAPPTLTQYNQWGQRIDKLETSEGWRRLKELSQREGVPGIFYERKFGEHSRTYGFAKSLLMIGDSQEVNTAGTYARVSGTNLGSYLGLLPTFHVRRLCKRSVGGTMISESLI
jgi:hypothetical protein